MSELSTFHLYTTDGKQVITTTVTQVFLALPQLEYYSIADTEVWQGEQPVFLSPKIGSQRHTQIQTQTQILHSALCTENSEPDSKPGFYKKGNN
jgi:hypothetical protein